MVQPIAATRQHHAAPATFWPQVLPSLAADVVLDGHCQNKMHDEQGQWPFQDPRLEVPTIYKAYVRPM